MQEAAGLDFGFASQNTLAILPNIYNANSEASQEIDVVRDVHGTMNALLSPRSTMVMLLRPDRYIAAATMGPTGRVGEPDQAADAPIWSSNESGP